MHHLTSDRPLPLIPVKFGLRPEETSEFQQHEFIGPGRDNLWASCKHPCINKTCWFYMSPVKRGRNNYTKKMIHILRKFSINTH